MQQSEVLRYDALHLVGNEYLVAVELNLVLLDLETVVDFWEERIPVRLNGKSMFRWI